MEGLPGQPLGILYCQIPPQHRAHFLDRLADYYLIQLGTLSFNSIGSLRYDLDSGTTNIVRLPGKVVVYNSSFEFVYDIRRKQNQLLCTDVSIDNSGLRTGNQSTYVRRTEGPSNGIEKWTLSAFPSRSPL